jgi:hypothetical protein
MTNVRHSTHHNRTLEHYSGDIKETSAILASMGATFREIETRGKTHLRGWIVNRHNVGVGWIVFENERYVSFRAHRSTFEFDCATLQLRLDNWQLKKRVDFERSRYLELHSECRRATLETENKASKGYAYLLLSKIRSVVSKQIRRTT